MANPDVAQHCGDNLEGADFRGADLVGRDFAGASAGEANFEGALLEDANLENGIFRFAKFDRAVLDGARCANGDFWGSTFVHAEAQDADFQGACLRDANMAGAKLQNADLRRANLHHINLSDADLRGADLTDAVFKGANLSSADLRGASLAGLRLEACQLDGVMFSGGWLERTRMTLSQLGGSVGEERVGNFKEAAQSYLALEINFRGLGDDDAARWAYCKRRRMGKLCTREDAVRAFNDRNVSAFFRSSLLYLVSVAAEVLCDYGESVPRVLRAIVAVYVFTLIAVSASGSLLKAGALGSASYAPARDLMDVATYTFMAIITGAPPAEFKLDGQLANLAVGAVTAAMIVLLGLLGFVLGNRIRG